MALIQVENAKLSFGTKTLFENIHFSVNYSDRIAIVGHNGCGKSSLIKALVGQHELDRGQIYKRKGLVIGYVPQEIPAQIEGTSCYAFLLDAIHPANRDVESWKVDAALASLGLRHDLWHSPVNRLSGGWRRLLLIAKATLRNPDLLIMDEPTNHLDLGKIFQLEKWLMEEIRAPYIVISHDREFLDTCTNKTLFMRTDGIHAFSAPFSIARENLLQQDAFLLKMREKEESEIKRLERAASRLKAWGQINPQSDLSRKGEAIQSRADRLREKQTSVYVEKGRDLSLYDGQISSRSALTITKMNVVTPDGRLLFRIERFSIEPGERICILGINGTGKSVFIRKIIDLFSHQGDYDPIQDGNITFSPQLRLGYLDQHLDRLPQAKGLYDFIVQKYQLDHTQSTRALVMIGFPTDRQHVKIGSLSSGERARLALLDLKLSKPNFYVLDEPTNHLDIQGQEDLEDELDNKSHTCLFVSHDRKMVRAAATRYLEIRNRELIEVDSPDPFFDGLKML